MLKKILIGLASFLAIVSSSRASLWGQGVFPDDIQWNRFQKRQHASSIDIDENVDNDYKICETEECKRIASEFISGMNQSADPCEDFYEFSCGGWGANITIPRSSMFWSHDSLYQNLVYYRLKNILENEANSDEILPVKQAKRWYRSCMNTERLKQKGMDPIESIVMQAGGWPIVMEEEEWNAEQHPWQSVERHYARLTGSHAFYDINAHPPAIEVREFRAIRIGPPKFLVARESWIKEGSSIDIIMKVLDMFTQENKTAASMERMKKEAHEIAKFETDLWTLMAEREYGMKIKGFEFMNWDTTDMYLEEFIDWYAETTMDLGDDAKSKIDWMTVIQTVFEIGGVKIDLDLPVYVNNLAFVQGIGKLLKRTPARTLVNYIHWDFIAHMLPDTNDEIRNYLYIKENQVNGVSEGESRWLECTRQITTKMPLASAYIFVKKYFTNSTESVVIAMMENVKNALEDNIEKSNWLDESSKALVKEKLNGMEVFMGLPKWYRNETAITNVYSGLVIQDEYFDNVLSYMIYERKADFSRFRTWEDSGELLGPPMPPLALNAEYNPMDNNINIPPVNFQSPLFTPGLPDNINYGLAGFTIGHEMGHGFDDHGIQFGKNYASTKLSMDILMSYFQRATCFTNQYKEYYENFETSTIDPKFLAENTRGENIADTTGLQAVFHAYKKMNEKKPNGDSKLPGLEGFSDYQLFFLSYAAAWCESERPEYLAKQNLSKDPHSPGRLRVIGVVSNTKDFAKVFNCPEGSSMNPSDKCSIWQKPGAMPKAISSMRNDHRWRWQ